MRLQLQPGRYIHVKLEDSDTPVLTASILWLTASTVFVNRIIALGVLMACRSGLPNVRARIGLANIVPIGVIAGVTTAKPHHQQNR